MDLDGCDKGGEYRVFIRLVHLRINTHNNEGRRLRSVEGEETWGTSRQSYTSRRDPIISIRLPSSCILRMVSKSLRSGGLSGIQKDLDLDKSPLFVSQKTSTEDG